MKHRILSIVLLTAMLFAANTAAVTVIRTYDGPELFIPDGIEYRSPAANPSGGQGGSPTPSATPEILSGADILRFASADELRTMVMQNYRRDVYLNDGIAVTDGAEKAAAEAPAAAPAPEAGAGEADLAADNDYSSTNTQVEGIDEGDIVKTDGEYIYHLDRGNARVRIYKAEGAQVSLVSEIGRVSIYQNGWDYISEMYLTGERLVLIGNRYEYSVNPKDPYDLLPEGAEGSSEPAVEGRTEPATEGGGTGNTSSAAAPSTPPATPSTTPATPSTPPDAPVQDDATQSVTEPAAPDMAIAPWYYDRSYSYVTVYDLTDMANPTVARSFELEGSFSQTRVMDGRLYFVGNKYVPYVYQDEESISADLLLPLYRDALAGDEPYTLVPAEDICYFKDTAAASSYLLMGVMDLLGDRPVTFESFLADGYQIYMSRENLYVIGSEYANNRYSTVVYRFSIGAEGVQYAAKGYVDGYVLNQYSMDEYEGVFRIATTDWGKGNYVTTMDSELRTLGRTPALAPDETIHSVRFMGECAYVVTYRQTDPLFSIDLSDPAKPTVMDALKIPGFSQYLHPAGDGLLIGFGRETEVVENQGGGGEIWTGTIDRGAKVSLFDISDPYALSEVSTLLLGEHTYSEAFNNPRALMVHKGRNLYAFIMNDYTSLSDGRDLYSYTTGIQLVAVENGALVNKGFLPFPKAAYDDGYNSRAVYIGNILYAATPAGVYAYDLDTLEYLG